MVAVSQRGTEGARLIVEFDGAQIFTAQVMKIGDVVVRFGHNQGKAVFLAVATGEPVRLFRARKIIQADVADRQVPEHRGNIQRLATLQKLAISPLVQLDSFLKPVLPVVDVGDVAVQPRQTYPILVDMKDLARLLAQFESAFILPVIDKAVQRAADGAGVVHIAPGLFKDLEGSLILLDRLFVLAGEVKNVSQGARALRGGIRIADLFGDPGAGLREFARLFQVHAGKGNHGVVEGIHRVLAVRLRMGSQKGAALFFFRNGCQVHNPLLQPEIRSLLRHLESELRQYLLQPVETTSANEAYRSRRQSEFLRHFVVRHRRLLVEKQLYQLCATRRKTLNGIANRLLFLHFLKNLRGGGNFLRDLLLHSVQLNILLLLFLPVEAFVGGHRNEP